MGCIFLLSQFIMFCGQSLGPHEPGLSGEALIVHSVFFLWIHSEIEGEKKMELGTIDVQPYSTHGGKGWEIQFGSWLQIDLKTQK